jgi:CDGSH-type Zn-finger protein
MPGVTLFVADNHCCTTRRTSQIAAETQRKELAMIEVNIAPSEDGPYLVSGFVHLTDVDGREIPHPEQMALCRCGGSKNKPFCDGSHRTNDFDGTLEN